MKFEYNTILSSILLFILMGYYQQYNYQPTSEKLSKGLNAATVVVLAYNLAFVSNILPKTSRVNLALEFNAQVYATALHTVDFITKIEQSKSMDLNIRQVQASIDAVGSICAGLLSGFRMVNIVAEFVDSKRFFKQFTFRGVRVAEKGERD